MAVQQLVIGVGGRATTKGSKRAIRAAAQLGAEAIKAKVWTDVELDAKAATAKRIGLKPVRWTPERGGWTAEQLALLGTDHDEAIAKKLGRSRSAVTAQRTLQKIPAFSGWPVGGPGWTADKNRAGRHGSRRGDRGTDRTDDGRGDAKAVGTESAHVP